MASSSQSRPLDLDLDLDHQRLTYRYAGHDFRLTDVAGSVVHPILSRLLLTADPLKPPSFF